jgi:hypothetical protein
MPRLRCAFELLSVLLRCLSCHGFCCYSLGVTRGVAVHPLSPESVTATADSSKNMAELSISLSNLESASPVTEVRIDTELATREPCRGIGRVSSCYASGFHQTSKSDTADKNDSRNHAVPHGYAGRSGAAGIELAPGP